MTAIDLGLDKTRTQSDASHARSDFASSENTMLAHDIRSAINGVIGGISLIDVGVLEQGQREQVARVAAAAEKLSWLVAAMLEDNPIANTDRVDIGALIDFVRRRWTGEARQKGMNLFVTVESGVPRWLNTNLVDLARMLANLIGNALRHTSSGTINLSVENTASHGMAFRVRDEGTGIDPAVLQQVIRQGHHQIVGAASGHGLGLAIVRGLAEKNFAETTFGNRPEGGFEAAIQFPARLCSNIDRESQFDSAARAAPIDLSGVRILLAEDNPTNQMVATQMLTKLRGHVTVASDGIEALEQFESGTFDLIVVDIEMPRLSGLDVIRAIRGRGDSRANVPIVALTAYAMREHQERIAEAGANGLISKPISSIEALGRALAVHISPTRENAKPVSVSASNDLASPGVNIAIFEALRQTIGPHMMAELMDKVIADLSSARADLSDAGEPVNRPAIRSASHILISVAGAIGATRLQNIARDLNIAAHSGSAEDIQSRLEKCLGEIDTAVIFARSERSRS